MRSRFLRNRETDELAAHRCRAERGVGPVILVAVADLP
jgi:hypothetical protein